MINMKRNNMYNTNPNTRKVLTKKDLSMIYGMTVVIYLFGSYFCKNQTVGLIIVAAASVFPLLIYITKIARKKVGEADVNKYFGIIGVYDAVVCALLVAYQRGNSVKEIIIIFAIICVIISAVIGLLELTCRKIINDPTKSKGSAVSTGVITAFAATGVLLSRYVRRSGIEIAHEYEIIMGIFSLVFSIFYLFLMKYRSLSKLQ